MSPEKLTFSQYAWAWKIGRLVVLNFWEFPVTLNSYYSEQTIATMPEGWKPKETTVAAMTTNNTPINVYVLVDKSGGNVRVCTSSGGEPIGNSITRGQVVYMTA